MFRYRVSRPRGPRSSRRCRRRDNPIDAQSVGNKGDKKLRPLGGGRRDWSALPQAPFRSARELLEQRGSANDGVGNFHASQPAISFAAYPKDPVARPPSQALLDRAEKAPPLATEASAAHGLIPQGTGLT